VKVVKQVERRLEKPAGAKPSEAGLNRATRTNRLAPNEIDWDRTIRKTQELQPDEEYLIADRLVGFGRKRKLVQPTLPCARSRGSVWEHRWCIWHLRSRNGIDSSYTTAK